MSEINRRKKVNGKTHFEYTWGIHSKELAKRDCVTPEALHMRVKLFGTPFQRLPQPSICELMYNKTNIELAREVGMHPTALLTRLNNSGSAYYESNYMHNQGKHFRGVDWKTTKWANKPQGWLAPEHPQHQYWRYNIHNVMSRHNYSLSKAAKIVCMFAKQDVINEDAMWEKFCEQHNPNRYELYYDSKEAFYRSMELLRGNERAGYTPYKLDNGFVMYLPCNSTVEYKRNIKGRKKSHGTYLEYLLLCFRYELEGWDLPSRDKSMKDMVEEMV